MGDGRARRLRAPLLLAFEALGGLVIFVTRLVAGSTPGETLQVAVDIALYAAYQWGHWARVRPVRPQLRYALGLIAALAMALTNLTGLWLAAHWWQDRYAVPIAAAVRYPPLLSGIHNVLSMVVLTFAGAHLGAVLFRGRNLER